jgi:hypothetical protein
MAEHDHHLPYPTGDKHPVTDFKGPEINLSAAEQMAMTDFHTHAEICEPIRKTLAAGGFAAFHGNLTL